jgi:hypothetical protein
MPKTHGKSMVFLLKEADTKRRRSYRYIKNTRYRKKTNNLLKKN